METTLNKKKLDKEASDRLSFIPFIIPEFADEYKMDGSLPLSEKIRRT
jgi:hypothetical protein